MTAAFSHSEPIPDATGALPMNMWVTVAEFGCPGGDRQFRVTDLDALIEELSFWAPSGLWSDDRYAIQLHIAAPSPYQALRVALDCHRWALRAVGLAQSSLLRVEVLTVEEMERNLEELGRTASEVALPVFGSGWHCPEVYAATRALLGAASAAEIAGIVDDFVIAVGARVHWGLPCHRPAMTVVDLDWGSGPARHATAEAISVSGLLLEQALPTLIEDARQAMARLQPPTPGARSAPGTLPPPTDPAGIGEVP